MVFFPQGIGGPKDWEEDHEIVARAVLTWMSHREDFHFHCLEALRVIKPAPNRGRELAQIKNL